MIESQNRRSLLTAALGFTLLEGSAPELALVHAWLDTWTGIGLVAAGPALRSGTTMGEIGSRPAP